MKSGRLHTDFLCGNCGAKWPCLAKQQEVIQYAIAKRKIEESNIGEHPHTAA